MVRYMLHRDGPHVNVRLRIDERRVQPLEHCGLFWCHEEIDLSSGDVYAAQDAQLAVDLLWDVLRDLEAMRGLWKVFLEDMIDPLGQGWHTMSADEIERYAVVWVCRQVGLLFDPHRLGEVTSR